MSRNNKNQESKRLTYILVAMTIVTLIIVINVSIFNNPSGNSNFINGVFARKGVSLIYFGRDDCTWSQQFEPNLNYLKKAYNFTYDYIDTNIYSQDVLNNILIKLNIDVSKFGTPTMAIVENGNLLGNQIGYIDEKPLFDYLKQYKIIKEDAIYVTNPTPSIITPINEVSYDNITNIDYAGFEKLNNGTDPFVLVIGQTGCSYCTKFKPVIDQVVKETSVTINYIDIKKLSEADYNNLIANINYFDNNSDWGTPLTLVINKKKTVDNLSGYVDIKPLKEFLKKNNF